MPKLNHSGTAFVLWEQANPVWETEEAPNHAGGKRLLVVWDSAKLSQKGVSGYLLHVGPSSAERNIVMLMVPCASAGSQLASKPAVI